MRDATPVASWLAVAMIIGGFVALGVTWYATATTVRVWVQLPDALSGGIVGLVLVGFGAAILSLQVTRVLAAEERARTDAATGAVLSLLVALRQSDPGENR